eukprot:TRINITY_DN13451_c0_g1_i3.p4 TRINITY_DN13451_c0_g1~~TRINITY_DN13451_c0_g1_i3.p4  ORF type:complete len:105 (+),score=12.56 TRINITY_DN13451_c0_g1_i3:1195-1509(+)
MFPEVVHKLPFQRCASDTQRRCASDMRMRCASSLRHVRRARQTRETGIGRGNGVMSERRHGGIRGRIMVSGNGVKRGDKEKEGKNGADERFQSEAPENPHYPSP